MPVWHWLTKEQLNNWCNNPNWTNRLYCLHVRQYLIDNYNSIFHIATNAIEIEVKKCTQNICQHIEPKVQYSQSEKFDIKDL